MDMDVTLRVTPEELTAEAESVQGHITSMQNKFSAVESAVSRSEGYWIGEAGDTHRQLYRRQKEEIDKIFRKLGEQVADLKAAARVYEQTEAAVEAAADSLPDQVLV